MIIFGWGGGKAKDLGPAMPFCCQRCQREGFARYFTVTKWFRLYFVPLIPYETKHFLVCPVCTAATPLTTKDERARAERLVGFTAALNSGATDEQTYRGLIAAELDGGFRQGLPASSAVGTSVAPLPQRRTVNSHSVRSLPTPTRAVQTRLELPSRPAQDHGQAKADLASGRTKVASSAPPKPSAAPYANPSAAPPRAAHLPPGATAPLGSKVSAPLSDWRKAGEIGSRKALMVLAQTYPTPWTVPDLDAGLRAALAPVLFDCLVSTAVAASSSDHDVPPQAELRRMAEEIARVERIVISMSSASSKVKLDGVEMTDALEVMVTYVCVEMGVDRDVGRRLVHRTLEDVKTAPWLLPGASAEADAESPLEVSHSPHPAHPSASEMKDCPDCAEEVRFAARKCRFCGYRFDLEVQVPTHGGSAG